MERAWPTVRYEGFAGPGRKTDVKDAAWIAELLRHGLLRGSFIASKPQRQLRVLTQYRSTQVQDHARVLNRLPAVLEDANLKLEDLDEAIARISAAIDQRLTAEQEVIALLVTIPGAAGGRIAIRSGRFFDFAPLPLPLLLNSLPLVLHTHLCTSLFELKQAPCLGGGSSCPYNRLCLSARLGHSICLSVACGAAPIRQRWGSIGTHSLECSRARIADDGYQKPAEDHKVSSLCAATKGLTGIKKGVYGAW